MRLAYLVLLAALGCSGSAPRGGSRESRPAPIDSDQALALYRQGRFAEAEPLWTNITAQRPRDADGWAYLGLTRIALDKVPEGEAALDRALALDADNAQAHYGIGLTRARQARLDEAIRAFERAIDSDPAHAYAHYQLGLAYNERGRTDRAILHLQRFIDLEPDAPEAPKVRALLVRLG